MIKDTFICKNCHLNYGIVSDEEREPVCVHGYCPYCSEWEEEAENDS